MATKKLICPKCGHEWITRPPVGVSPKDWTPKRCAHPKCHYWFPTPEP